MERMSRTGVGMRDMEWECEQWNGNARNQHKNAGNLVGNKKNKGNQGGDVGNQDGNLSYSSRSDLK